MLKLKGKIEIRVWTDGQGFGEQEVIRDEVGLYPCSSIDELITAYDWYWWMENEWYTPMKEGEDLEITVSYYNPEAGEEAEPLAEVSTWQSEIE